MAEQKLYPPILEGSIPSFYGTVLAVPFSMNRAVSFDEIGGFELKIKTIQSNNYLFNIKSYSGSDSEAYFTLNEEQIKKLNVGQFYKVQIAFCKKNTGEVGYYSNVSLVKYTTEPDVSILNLSAIRTNNIAGDCVGVFSQIGKDTTEKLYSYSFDVYNHKYELIETSGEQLHNINLDDKQGESHSYYKVKTSFKDNEIYYLKYNIKTINGLTKSSISYPVGHTIFINSNLTADLIVKNNFENGFLQLDLKSTEEDLPCSGNFLISRSSSLDNFETWEDLFSFGLNNKIPTKKNIYQDFTVQQGVYYRYSIQQFTSFEPRIYSNRQLSKTENGLDSPVMADFEDAFLFDGKRQLKIRYNPKINNFKTDLLESKVETIGSKYPFIFRNGNVSYKEFSISGLISYKMDEDNFYKSKESLGLDDDVDDSLKVVTDLIPLPKNIRPSLEDFETEEEYYAARELFELKEEIRKAKDEKIAKKKKNLEAMKNNKIQTTNLINYNIAAERIFKLDVLDWLNDGEIKLFRSPAEGNYLVRLLNTSLSPNDSLGRMLHTFTSTAYEITDFTYENLLRFNFIDADFKNDKNVQIESVDIARTASQGNLLQHPPATGLFFTGCTPGDFYVLSSEEGTQRIMIGATGTYLIEDCLINSVSAEGRPEKGILTYGYYSNVIKTAFDKIEGTESKQYLLTFSNNWIKGYTNTNDKGTNVYTTDWVNVNMVTDQNSFGILSSKNNTKKVSNKFLTTFNDKTKSTIVEYNYFKLSKIPFYIMKIEKELPKDNSSIPNIGQTILILLPDNSLKLYNKRNKVLSNETFSLEELNNLYTARIKYKNNSEWVNINLIPKEYQEYFSIDYSKASKELIEEIDKNNIPEEEKVLKKAEVAEKISALKKLYSSNINRPSLLMSDSYEIPNPKEVEDIQFGRGLSLDLGFKCNQKITF